MDSIYSGLFSIAALMVLLALGVPIAWSMVAVAVVGMWFVIDGNFAMSMLETLPYDTGVNFTLVVIPMFILMGGFSSRAGIIEGLYEAVHRFTARTKGNLIYATILASAGFAAASGSTLVSSTVFTRIAMPQMLKFGYSPGISAGSIAASGTLAALIPPSVGIIIIASLTNQSVGELLIAGVVPGILTAGAYISGMRLFLVRYPQWAPLTNERYSWRDKMGGLRMIWSVVLLATLIIGGLYSGLFSPSAAGAVGAAGALIIGLSMRRLSRNDIWESFKEGTLVSGRLLMIIIGGLLMGRLLLINGFTDEINNFVASLGVTPLELMIYISIMFIVMGMFVDSLSLIVITLPFLFPISQSLGINEIWFGIIILKLIEIAAITPPVGLNLFAVMGAAPELKASELYRGIVPFILIEIVVLILLFAFPDIVLWLPETMAK
ncbi:TRAP transporter large permease [Sneathiella sp.]|uniref:TRAP transporter large permease n=1 Tax=Sneathiella sp. TaxID=1964365 RepID=UPI0026082289|nr:TRAP transporter large permease subunit [Sneathiella sp.]MDF2366856.1 TRAP transporter large permease subunit [Sneathiella sp.]